MIDIPTALILTLIIESCALFILKEKRIKVYVCSIILNTITNLSLNIFLTQYAVNEPIAYFLVLFSLEVAIWFIEGMVYYFVIKDFKKSLKYSFILNLSSFLIGLVISFVLIIINYYNFFKA